MGETVAQALLRGGRPRPVPSTSPSGSSPTTSRSTCSRSGAQLGTPAGLDALASLLKSQELGPARYDGTTAQDGEETAFADWMAAALRREGMTMEVAARQLGVSVKTVSRWVGGATEPRLRDLRRIRELFGDFPLP